MTGCRGIHRWHTDAHTDAYADAHIIQYRDIYIHMYADANTGVYDVAGQQTGALFIHGI